MSGPYRLVAEAAPAVGYLGVDPGAGGGLALLAGRRVLVSAMPATEAALWYWLQRLPGQFAGPVRAVVELVHAMPTDGRASAFKFGVNYGRVLMALTAAGIPYELVRPAAWQAGLHIPSREKRRDGRAVVWLETRTEFKRRLREAARGLFPRARVTTKTADALLIAEYCRRTHEGRSL